MDINLIATMNEHWRRREELEDRANYYRTLLGKLSAKGRALIDEQLNIKLIMIIAALNRSAAFYLNVPWLALTALVATTFAPAAALGTEQSGGGKPPDKHSELEIIEVTGSVPLGGILQEEGAPFAVQTFSRQLLDESRSNSMADRLQRFAGSVSVAEAQNNPLQPDLYFRGFTASPLLGSPQGLVVYQNGVRVNDIFADTVNWDLLPETLIDRISLVGGSNPGYGLNALGGAIVLSTRTAFNSDGGEVSASDGAFGRRKFSLFNSDRFAADEAGEWGYLVAADHFSEDSWRDFSTSRSNHLYGALSWRGENREADLYLQGGDTRLYGNGALPESMLREDRNAVFTHPDITENRLAMASLSYRQQFEGDRGLRVSGFVRDLVSDGFNGDASEFEPCEAPLDEAFLCTEDGAPAADQNGAAVSSEYNAVNNINRRDQRSYGVTLEITWQASVANRPLHAFVVGLDTLHGRTGFDSRVEFAELTATRGTTRPGLFDVGGGTDLSADIESYALYFSDTLVLTEELQLIVSGRFNNLRIKNRDRSGERPELDASHRFSRANGGLGLTYQWLPKREFYAGVSRTSRVPTAVELACSHPEAPCLLPNTFLADPPLDDVVSQNVEMGIRGQTATVGNLDLSHWRLSLFRTVNRDDILFQSTGGTTGNQGFFSNAGDTERRGLELSVAGPVGRGHWFAHYNYLQARFIDRFTAYSPLHPLATEAGLVRVDKNSDIPGIPRHSIKVGMNYPLSKKLAVGVDASYFSGRYLRGDEANLLGKINGYSLVNTSINYKPTKALTIYLDVRNLFDKEYESFGLLGEVGDIFADGDDGGGEDREEGEPFSSPGEPFGVWLGARYRWN